MLIRVGTLVGVLGVVSGSPGAVFGGVGRDVRRSGGGVPIAWGHVFGSTGGVFGGMRM